MVNALILQVLQYVKDRTCRSPVLLSNYSTVGELGACPPVEVWPHTLKFAAAHNI